MATPVEPPWRCSKCGFIAPPDPMKTQLDPRFATGYCANDHGMQTLIRAGSIAEAVEGYHRLLEAADRKKAAKLRDAKP